MAIFWIGDKNAGFQDRLRAVVNQRCKEWGGKKRLTQVELAEKIGFENPETFKSYLKKPIEKVTKNGKKEITVTYPPLPVYKKICDGLEIPYGFLLGDFIPFSLYESGFYGFLKRIDELEVTCNPENEEEICLKLGDYSAFFKEKDLRDEIIKYIECIIVRENIKKEK